MIRFFIILAFKILFTTPEDFSKEIFLSNCNNSSCLKCENFEISANITETFKTNEFNISSHDCIIFQNASLGNVNGDFFKQFPETKQMTFSFSNISFKSSEKFTTNSYIKFLEITGCNITQNHPSNALEALPNLEILDITGNNFEHKTMEKDLFGKNVNLTVLHLRDERSHLWKNTEPSEILKIKLSDSLLDNLTELEYLHIEIRKLENLPENFFKNNQKLKFLEIKGPLKEFPKDLPESVTGLRFEFTKFSILTVDNLKTLKNLKSLVIRESRLENIDETAFDQVPKLEELILDFNKITRLSARHLANVHLKEYSVHTIV